MMLYGNTTFTGDGWLLISNWDTQKPSIDLMEENLTVTLNGPGIVMESKNCGIRGKNNTGTFHLKSGNLSLKPFSFINNVSMLKGMGDVIYDQGMGVQQPHGASFNWQTHSMVDKDGNEIKGEEVTFGPIKWYGFCIYGIEITENNYDLIGKWNSVRSGNVNYDPQTNTLKLDNATLNNQSVFATIDNYDNDGLRIRFEGKNNFTFSGNRDRKSMYLRKNTIIEGYDGTGSLTVSGDAPDGGIYVASSKMLTVKNVTLNVPSLVGGNAYCNLHVGDGVEINAMGSNCFSGNTDDYVTSEDPSGDNNIREVNIKSFLPPTGTYGNSIDMTNAFGNVADDAVLYVPTGALQNYNVQPWTTWFSRIEEKPFFMDPDGIKDIDHSPLTIDHSWYDMSGRKLSGKPAQRGLYIMGGKKVVIK